MIASEITFLFIVCLLYGLCLGSFTTALMYRVPRGISWVRGKSLLKNKSVARSRCSNCNTTLSSLDLIPLFSWVFLKGKCRHCGVKISVLYPLIELSVVMITLVLWHIWGAGYQGLVVAMFVPFLVTILSLKDYSKNIPWDIVVAFCVVSLAFVVVEYFDKRYLWENSIVQNHIATAIVLPVILWGAFLILQKKLGFTKFTANSFCLFAAFGLFLGVGQSISMIVFAIFIYGIASFWSKSIKKDNFFIQYCCVFSFFIHLFLTGIGFYGRI